MQQFLEAGFILREDIVKVQWHTKTTREKWTGLAKTANQCWIEEPKGRFFTDFYLIAHEHLFIFKKPSNRYDVKKYKYSIKMVSNYTQRCSLLYSS